MNIIEFIGLVLVVVVLYHFVKGFPWPSKYPKALRKPYQDFYRNLRR